MLSGFDFNKNYKTLGERLLAAKSALRSTTYGLGGAVRVEEDPSNLGHVRFVVNATGDVYKTMNQAINRASSLFISQTIQVTNPKMGNKLAGLGAVMMDVKKQIEQLQKDPLKNADKIRILKEANIDISQISKMQVDVVTLGGADPQKMADKVLRMRETGELHGIASVDDKGGRILTMRIPKTGSKTGEMLSAEQINLLLRITGHGLIQEEEIFEALKGGSSDKLAKTLLKYGKRFRTFVSERELSFAGKTLFDLTGQKDMTRSFLVLDPQYDMMMMFAKQNSTKGGVYNFYESNRSGAERKAMKAYYKDRNVNSYFGKYLEELTVDERRRLADTIEKHAAAAKVGKGKFASDELKRLVELEFSGKADEKLLKAFQNSYASIEYAFDGSDLLNKKFISSYKNRMQGKIRQLTKVIDDPLQSKAAKEAAAYELKNLQNIYRQIGDLNFEQIIGRGNLPGYGNIKTAFDLTSTLFDEDELKGYVGIISKFGLKAEMGLAGKEGSLLLSGFGKGRDLVYVDPVSAAFHPEIFADPETLRSMEASGEDVLRQFQAAIDQGTVPRKLKTLLQKQAESTVEHLPAEARASASRNREFARAILEMLDSGVSPRESPRMMNMLHKIYATQAFRTEIARDGSTIYQPVLPETYRFALDTEKSLKGSEAVLGSGFEKFKAEGMQQAQDILTFRLKGHKMYFAPQAMGQVRGSLGGFDLDDKGIAKMFKYTDDNGMTRIAFNLTRQPSGVEEKMLARAFLDEDTIRSLFAENEKFTSSMEKYIEKISADLYGRSPRQSAEATSKAFTLGLGPDASELKSLETVKALKRILEGESIKDVMADLPDVKTGKVRFQGVANFRSAKNRFRTELESAIESVYRQMELEGKTTVRTLTQEQIKQIEKSGTASLRVQQLLEGGEEVKPRYSRAGIYNVFGKQGAFDMTDQMTKAIEGMPLSQKVKTEILSATSFDEMLSIIGRQKNLSSLDYDVAIAGLTSAFQHKSLESMKKGGDILGSYINRSMVVGSTLNQYEAFLNESTKDVRDFLLKNFQIGMLYQEEAIDYSVNAIGTSRVIDFQNQRAFHRESTRILTDIQKGDIAFHNLEGVERSIQQLIGAGKTTANLGLDAIGQTSVKSLGQLIGAQRAISKGISGLNEDLMLGIDEMLIKERLSNQDTRLLLENIISGMKKAYEFDDSLSRIDDNTRLLSELESTLARSPDDVGKIQEIIIQNFALRSDHTFASLSKFQDISSRLDSYMESARRTAIANIDDDILKAAETTAQSDVFAQEFIKRNKKLLDDISTQFADDLSEMSGAQLADHTARINLISGKLLQQIDEGSKLQGMTMETLVNSLDKAMNALNRGRRSGAIDIGRLTELRDVFDLNIGNLESVQERIAKARRLRSAKFYQSFDQQFAESAIAELGVRTERELADAAEQILSSSQRDDKLLQATYQILAGTPDEVTDELLKKEAQIQARIIRENLFLQESAAEIDELTRIGTISTAEEIVQNFGDDAAISEDILRSVMDFENYDPVNKATFKTFSQKIKDGDFKQLFKDPLIKRGTLALGALVAGSFAYTAIRDRTADDMSGPPLLPGGSAYEQNYPTRIPEIGSFSGQGYNEGSSYNVSINGSPEDVERFNQAARGLVNGNMSTTIFDRIPDLRTDLYSMFGSSY